MSDRLSGALKFIKSPEFVAKVEQKQKNFRIREVIRVRRWQRKNGIRKTHSLDANCTDEGRTFHEIMPSSDMNLLESLMFKEEN